MLSDHYASGSPCGSLHTRTDLGDEGMSMTSENKYLTDAATWGQILAANLS